MELFLEKEVKAETPGVTQTPCIVVKKQNMMSQVCQSIPGNSKSQVFNCITCR